MNKEKLILYGVLTLIVFLILDKFLGLSKGWKEEREADDAANLGLDVKEKEITVPPTYPLSWYSDQAGIIYTSLDKFYQDENSVAQSISKIKNSTDFLLLQRAFGVKQNKNLVQWVRDGLRNSDVKKLNDYLIKKNIPYRF